MLIMSSSFVVILYTYMMLIILPVRIFVKINVALGVSRQAVSKWENGTSDPSTSNLIALAKLFGISAEELLREVEGQRTV